MGLLGNLPRIHPQLKLIHDPLLRGLVHRVLLLRVPHTPCKQLSAHELGSLRDHDGVELGFNLLLDHLKDQKLFLDIRDSMPDHLVSLLLVVAHPEPNEYAKRKRYRGVHKHGVGVQKPEVPVPQDLDAEIRHRLTFHLLDF